MCMRHSEAGPVHYVAPAHFRISQRRGPDDRRRSEVMRNYIICSYYVHLWNMRVPYYSCWTYALYMIIIIFLTSWLMSLYKSSITSLNTIRGLWG